jgi:hypothetical protein
MLTEKEIATLEKNIVDIGNNIKSLIEQIAEAEDKLKQLYAMLNEIMNLSTKALENFIFNYIKEYIEKIVKVDSDVYDLIEGHYRKVNFSDNDKYYLGEAHHPFSHNPAHLCWIYLKTKNNDEKNYFSDYYLFNTFMEDTLDGNFKFEGGRAVPTQ